MTRDNDEQVTRIIERPGPKDHPFLRPEERAALARPVVAAPAPAAEAPPAMPAAPAVAAPPAALRIAPVEAPPAPVEDKPLLGGAIARLQGIAAKLAHPSSPRAAADLTPPPVAMPAVSPFVARASEAPAAVAPPRPATPPVAPVVTPEPLPPEPVVGWLVVVKGPGRGAALALRGGRNALGSGADQDLRLDFGDRAVAPSGHLFLIYDDEARAFFIEDGKKKDLVRLNGQMLSETRPLAPGDRIRIGQTTLAFVAFCGPDFDWADEGEPVAAETPPGASSVD